MRKNGEIYVEKMQFHQDIIKKIFMKIVSVNTTHEVWRVLLY